MNTIIWVLQGVTAALFIMAGLTKSLQSKEKLEQKMPWIKDASIAKLRFIGITELLGGIGLIVPLLTGIAPVLTALAAIGLALIMVLAAEYHLRKKEYKAIAFNTVLLVFCVVVAVYRF